MALADELEAAVRDLAPGSRLESENELQIRWDVSRITARAALQELERRHAVRRLRGSGTFVALRIPYPIRSDMQPSWSRIVRNAGHEPSYDVLGVHTQRAPAAIARALGISRRRSVTCLRRIGRVDSMVAVHQTMWLPSSLVPGLEQQIATHESLATTLTEVYGLPPRRRWSTADLSPAPATIADLLDLTGRPPTWRINSVNVAGPDDIAIEANQAWMRADCFEVRLETGPSDSAAGPGWFPEPSIPTVQPPKGRS